MTTIKRENKTEKNAKVEAPERKLRTLTVRSGITAGMALAGCSPCHRPSNHNETLVVR